MGEGGGSAERRAHELGAAGDPAAAAWAAGAAGERRVAAALANLLESWTVLHDRLLRPGRSEANLDHVVIGPSGVYLIDAKSRAGRVVEWEGGLWQHTMRDGNAVSESLAGELAKVHGMAATMAAESGLRVIPVLCLAGAREAEFGAPQQVRGVWVVPVSHLVTWLLSWPHVHSREEVERMATRTMTDFPSTTTDPDLLKAIGAAAASPDTGRRANAGARRGVFAPPPPAKAARRRRSRRRKGLLLQLVVGLALLLSFPTVLSAFAEWMGHVSNAQGAPLASPTTIVRPGRPLPTPPGQRTVSKPVGSTPARRSTPSRQTTPARRTATAPPVVLEPDCAHATQAEVSRILGRRVQPVATSSGCAWGTRLDDSSTVLVNIQLRPGDALWDYRLKTSAQQRRVVYGTGVDPNYRQATALFAAKGVRLAAGSHAAVAGADLMVTVSTRMLGLTDDQARRKALALAVAANS